ncbi:CLIP-associating protein 1a [Brachionichthys hirsutus]|uniref:CLIP-associating protein 1a n=1 Tax=Brachionichthys hirsutus TaxID=412623 RepID=UPI003604B8BF
MMEPSMENCLAQVLQKDMGRRLQVGQEIVDFILDEEKSHDLEQDQTALDKMVDGIASSWVNCSNFKVALLGLDLLSAVVTRLQDRFRAHVGTVLPNLIDRLGDAKDQVRDQDQSLLLKIMEQSATPQYVWDRMLGGFKHKNNRTREGACLCLIATLNTHGAQGLTLSKIVPHICNLLGDPTSQVRDGAMTCLVEIYRHVGERVRMDLSKKGLPQSRFSFLLLFYRTLARSRIPRPSMSQGCSRESSRDTSPARGFAPLASRRHSRSTSALSAADPPSQSDRYGLIHQARISASVNAMRVLNTGTEVEAAVADALLLGDSRNKRKPLRRRYESPGMYSDDDANSDASSACSERSYGSRNGGVPHYLRQTEDVAEILNHCASANWSERKEGLLGLQNLLKSQRILSRVELKRLCEIFTRMFADPDSKVFSMFLETLVDFITVHREDLQDWLFVLLTQLLKKMGADLLGSVQAKVQKALDVTRESFPFDQQFNILMRFIVDQTQTPNLKVKVAILKCIESLARQMDPTDFVNSSETRLAVSRIITWTTEPKSSDVRKTLHSWLSEELAARSGTASLSTEGNQEERCKQAAQVVLISLFELNTPEFTMLLGALPKTFQDGATKLLHNHLKNSSNGGGGGGGVGSPSNSMGRTPPRHAPSRTSPLTSPTNCSHGGLSPSRLWGWGVDGLSKHPPAPAPAPAPPPPPPAAPSLRVLRRAYSPSMAEYDTENMNSEEIYSSLRGVTEAIQSFSYRSQEDLNEPIKRDDAAGREGVASSPGSDARLGLDMVEGGRTALDNKTSLLNTPSPRSFSGPRGREFAPYGYGETICTYDKSALKEAVFDDDVEQFRDCRRQESGENKMALPKAFAPVAHDHSDLVADLLKELSNHNERSEERKGALVELLKITREDSRAVWDEHFKTVLLLLLETLGDKDHAIRALALRVLKEILKNQPARFKNYAELTIMKTLEAHKDSHKEVVRAAEEAASTLAGSIHSEQCIKVLCPIVQTADYPIDLAAIKMQTKVIERIAKDALLQLLPDIIPGLLQGYDNTESSVRKASVFCLVAIYAVIGEDLKPHLVQLTGSKMKLLNLYIKRAQTTNSNSSSSSDVSSHS